MRTYYVLGVKIVEALSSYIHVSLYIPFLSSEGREQIWVRQFDALKRYNPDVVVDNGADKYATTNSEELKLNGREIRNGIN